MELEEVETINLRDTALPFACIWSEDDTLSILSENEVHILKLKPNMRTVENTINFVRQTIKPRNEFANKELLPLLNELLYKEQRLNVYNIINDGFLSPDGKILDCQDIIPKCSQFCWSPAGVYKSQCALVFLNNMGNVDIQVNHGQFWIVIADLTKFYVKKTELFKNIEAASLDYENLKTYSYKASSSCVDWSPLYEKHYSYIITGQLNSDILVWKFYNLSISKIQRVPELVLQFSTNMARLTMIHWIKTSDISCIIIAGDIKGDVKSFVINDLENVENFTNSHDYWVYNDCLRVDKIFCEQIGFNFLITCIKRANVVLFLIANDGVLLDHKVKKIGNLTITGFQKLKTGTYVLCTLTSYTGLLTVTVKKNFIENVQLNEVKNPVNTNYMTVYGICCSPQKAIWFICSNYCKPINHLIIREPIQLTICSNRVCDVESILSLNKQQTLTNHWDCLELCRLLHDKKEFPTLYELVENYDDFSLYRLKIYFWLAIFNENILKKKKRVGKQIINEIYTPPEDLLQLIKIKYCLERLKSIQDSKDLNELQLLSVRYLRENLMESTKTETFKAYLGKNIEKEIHLLLEETKQIPLVDLVQCSLCDADVTYNGKCLNGHQENQCIKTFVPFSSLWYPSCPNCDCPAHPHLTEDPLICTICDNLMIFCDYKLVDDLNK